MSLTDIIFNYLNSNGSYWLHKPPGNVTLEGTSFAALIVERLLNMSYEEYTKEKILKPLNIDLTQSGFRLTDIKNPDDLVYICS
ncbi:unnamed protein product [Rotaria sp. Silwood2]|nr:unnamed protein product [Rotaria sp. Silwood2]CAF4370490.1 unnamed protein product [Rotaria sp. Silwood2]